jgi:cAMP phosphodiesterase
MDIRVLGCHGSDGLDPPGTGSCNTCGFLLNDRMLIDAGTVGSKLSQDAQQRIRHVILSHLHFDHIKGLPGLADNLSEQVGAPVVVGGIPDVVEGLRRHIFNSRVYPDFFAIPSSQHPTLAPLYLQHGKTSSLGGVDLTPIFVNHTVPTTGFLIRDRSAAFVYSGDTYSTDVLWEQARQVPQLKAAFIECSYPDGMATLARVSKHLTPALLAQELHKLDRPDVAIYAYHLKPVYKEKIVEELARMHIPNLTVLEEGQYITL